ncbi:MAG: thiamine diphosphokinase [Oscillospiraceae bacterium]|nr:thiamine diphosphokinase [Oscillospiraceae bacterium]
MSADAARPGPGRCVIFTARCQGDPAAAYDDPREDDLILCADGGYTIAHRAGAAPAAVIGDFDSAPPPGEGTVIRHPVVKNDTDTMLCVKYAWERGRRSFLIIGGLGGRLDHTLANLQTLLYIAERGGRAVLSDGRTRLQMLKNQTVTLPRTEGKLSVFAFGGRCEGVSVRGTKYEVEDIALTPDFPLGMGNDFAAGHAEISVRRGALLVVCELEKE